MRKEKFLLSNEDGYLNSIQALRAIAFLAIVTYHCGITPGGPWGVSVFLVISGFCLVYGYSKRAFPVSVKHNFVFVVRRTQKLYPLHIILMIFVILRECIEKNEITVSLMRVFADSFLLTSWIPSNLGIVPYNGVAWYLSTIVFCYFLFGYTFLFVSQICKKKQAILGIACVYLIQIIVLISLIKLIGINDEMAMWFTYECPIYRFGDFLIGCFLGKFYLMDKNDVVDNKKYSIMEIGIFFICIISLIIYGLKRGVLGSESVRYSLLFTPSSIMLVYVFAHRRGIFTRILTNRITVSLASISAAGFLIHQVVIYTVKTIIDGGGTWKSFGERLSVFVISFIVTAIIAKIYNKVYETLKNKRIA